jgi:hypothetical protein
MIDFPITFFANKKDTESPLTGYLGFGFRVVLGTRRVKGGFRGYASGITGVPRS